MASSRDTRRYAFQALYQLDARGPQSAEQVQQWLAETVSLNDDERMKIFMLALAAFERRSAADGEFHPLAPTWPAHRQPAVDRAILRLAHYELSQADGVKRGKLILNDAIELSKEYSTDRSPAFVNGLLDKVLQRVRNEAAAGADSPSAANSPSAPSA